MSKNKDDFHKRKVSNLYRCLGFHCPVFSSKKEIIQSRNRAPASTMFSVEELSRYGRIYLPAGTCFLLIGKAGKYNQYLNILFEGKTGWILDNVSIKNI